MVLDYRIQIVIRDGSVTKLWLVLFSSCEHAISHVQFWNSHNS